MNSSCIKKYNIILKIFIFIILINNVISVQYNNCKIKWIENGQQIDDLKFIIELSIKNTSGDYRTYMPLTNYDGNYFNLFYLVT